MRTIFSIKKYAVTTDVIRDAGGVDQAVLLPGDGRSLFLGVQWQMQALNEMKPKRESAMALAVAYAYKRSGN